MGRTEEKEFPKKGVLGRDIKSSSTGVTRRDPSLSAKALFPFPFPSTLAPLRLPCLAKTRRLSLKVTRRNRRRVTRACKRVEEGERAVEGKGREGGSPPVGDRPREPRGRRCTHSSRYIMDTAENPLKGSTRNKGHPHPPPHCSSSVVSLPRPPLSPRVLKRPAFSVSWSSSIPTPFFFALILRTLLNLSLVFTYTFLSHNII